MAGNEAREKYNRISKLYNILEWPAERLLFSRWRKELISGLKGKVLEVGMGTGKNLPYYDYKKAHVTAIDISEGMLAKARRLAKEKHYPAKLVRMDAQKIRFKSKTFDVVVCTFILCSVPDPVKALREMRRVCKEGGRIIMLEHVLSRNRVIAAWEKLHNPLTNWLLGVNINRDTRSNIEKAGIKVIEDKSLAVKDVFRKFVGSP